MRSCLLALAGVLAAAATGMPARADPAADRAAIVERLQRWTAAFNAGDAQAMCDLFAPDLVAVTPAGLAESRDALCARLAAVLARPGLRLQYDSPDIREIMLSGDVAVVRLVWTLTTRKGTEQDVSTEPGIDVFQRQPDGKWSIARFAAFTYGPPSKNLP